MSKKTFLMIGHEFRNHKLSELKGAKLSVLLCLALHMNEYGHAWPAIERIVHLSGYSRSQVKRSLKWLREKHYITKQENPGVRSNTYLLTVPHLGEHMIGSTGEPYGVHLRHAVTQGKMSEMNPKVDTEKNIQQEDNVVVLADSKPKDISPELWNYSKDKCKGPNIEAYARGVLRRNPGWKPPKKDLDPDSDESRQRYVNGEYADFFEDG